MNPASTWRHGIAMGGLFRRPAGLTPAGIAGIAPDGQGNRVHPTTIRATVDARNMVFRCFREGGW